MGTFRSKAMPKAKADLWLRRFYYALEHHGDKLAMRFKKDMVDDREAPGQTVTRTRFGIPGNITGLHERWSDPYTGKLVAAIITVNPSRRRYGGQVKVFIHELIHHVRPKWTEKQVKETENLIYEALSNRQLWNLMRKIFTLY